MSWYRQLNRFAQWIEQRIISLTTGYQFRFFLYTPGCYLLQSTGREDEQSFSYYAFPHPTLKKESSWLYLIQIRKYLPVLNFIWPWAWFIVEGGGDCVRMHKATDPELVRLPRTEIHRHHPQHLIMRSLMFHHWPRSDARVRIFTHTLISYPMWFMLSHIFLLQFPNFRDCRLALST